MKIPHYLPSQIRLPLLNKIEIQEHSYRDSFLIWATYWNENAIQVHVRKLDENKGWDHSMIIKLYNVSNHDEWEAIPIGPSSKQEKVLQFHPKKTKIIAYDHLITPVLNKIKIHKHSFADSFMVWTDYHSRHSLTIYIKRIDAQCGWGQQLRLRLYHINESSWEDITIGSSFRQEMKLTYATNTIEMIPYITSMTVPTIPLKIYQTHRYQEFQSPFHESAHLSITQLNPEYEYYYFTDESARNWISEYYEPRVLKCYDMLIPNAYKADFFRICILYQWGGCYFDHKHVLRFPLRQFFNHYSSLSSIYCIDLNPEHIHNGIIFSAPHLPPMKHFLDSMIQSIENHRIPSHDLGITGPNAIVPFVPEYTKVLSFTSNHLLPFDFRIKIIATNEDFVFRSYPGYYSNHRLQDYGKMFLEKQIYYQNYQEAQYKDYDCIFMTCPELAPSNEIIDIDSIENTYKMKSVREKFIDLEKKRLDKCRVLYPDQFHISYQHPDLFVVRTDQNTGWNIDLFVIMVIQHYYHKIHVGQSDSNEKRIRLDNIY